MTKEYQMHLFMDHTGCPKIKETHVIWLFLSSKSPHGINLIGVSESCFRVDFQNVKNIKDWFYIA